MQFVIHPIRYIFSPNFSARTASTEAIALVFKTVTKSRYFLDSLSRDHDFLTFHEFT